ncbi:MAG: glycosyltransferase family 39 protein [Candidatus Binatia bacterium]
MVNETRPGEMGQSRGGAVFAACLGLVAFWGLRARYWSITREAPFSDMADFESIAVGVREHFRFDHTPFWRQYRPPVTPLLRAGVMLLFGRDASLDAWHWCLAGITCLGLVWLCVELAQATGRRWPALLLLWLVACTKSSIFWSLKMASEGPAEAVLYWAVAATLRALRMPRPGWWLTAGLLYATAVLTRPIFAPVALLGPPVALVTALLERGRGFVPPITLRRATALAAVMALGVGIGWAPWLVRSYRLYGHVVPLTTQGPYSFIFELGAVTLRPPDGLPFEATCESLQAEAPSRFPNDYEASRWAQGLVAGWVAENWPYYLRTYALRIPRTAADLTVTLTRVSRTELFRGPLDQVLPDKTGWLFLGGIGGLVVATCALPRLSIWALACLGSWVFGMVTIGEPRIVEPIVPMVLAGNLGWLTLLRDDAPRAR